MEAILGISTEGLSSWVFPFCSSSFLKRACWKRAKRQRSEAPSWSTFFLKEGCFEPSTCRSLNKEPNEFWFSLDGN